ncbi:LPS-assembly protein LptD @ Organic solvent tolerance protein precursor [uncultured Gammaproteobacteria bacterium]|nr:LPS-assembly protein LptD @ Organic solvent tolerance protein precursor [uncultured Gammaproteobacteria bacterium]
MLKFKLIFITLTWNYLMRKQLVLFTLVLLPGMINAQERGYAISCGSTPPLLFPKQVLATDSKDIKVVADHSESSKGNYLLTGNASLNSAEFYLSADKITVEKNAEVSGASGNVKFQSKQVMLTADNIFIKKQNKATQSIFEQAQYHYTDTKINGKAKKIVNDGSKQIFDSMTYSLCPIGNTDWQMKADKVTLNPKTNYGIAKNVTIEFMGIPIFYTPHYEWVLKGRDSGFLMPSIGSYTESDSSKNNGYQFRIPYYFNLAPNRDFLLILNQLTTRGSVIEGKYRQLLNKGRIEIEGHYLNKDKIKKDNRWLLNTQLNLSLNKETELTLITNRVSDRAYFKEIAHENTDKSALMSSINVGYENKKNNLSASIFAENEQLLSGNTEYTRVPEISISKKVINPNNREINFSTISTKFKHKDPTKETGTRLHTQAAFVRNIETSAYSIKPKFTLSKTKYLMDDKANEDRSIYSFNIDSKLLLERNTYLFGKNSIQTLTPRLAYNYTPERNQSALANFDSEKINESYENLFSGKKFTGLDRISKTNDIVIGLESDFINKKTGATYLTLKIAQARHLNDTTLNKEGNLVSQKKYSNIATDAELTLDKFTLGNTLQYDPNTSKIAKSSSLLGYVVSPKKFINFTHSNDGEQRSAGIYGAYPVTQKIHLFAGINRSLTDSINNKKTAGIAYESCCWAVRIVRFNEYTGADTYDKITKFELILKGLASSDSTLAKRLKKEIPNYLTDLNN